MKTNVGHIEEHIEHLISLLVEYTPRLIGAFLVLFVGLWLIKHFAKLADKAMAKKELDISLKTFLLSLLSVGLKVILIVTVAGMIGIGTTSFVTILGAAGLAVGLALQGSLSNFAGGVLLLIFKPYKVGDTIEAQGQIGKVTEIEIFNTILITNDLKTIILPNGAVSNGTIVNYSQHGLLRVNVEIVVSASNDIDKVKELILHDVIKHSLAVTDPKPEVAAIKIIDNAVTLSVRVYCKSENNGLLHSDLVEIIKKTLEKNRIDAPVQKRLIQNL